MKMDEDVINFLQSEKEAYIKLAREAKDAEERAAYMSSATTLAITLNNYVCKCD